MSGPPRTPFRHTVCTLLGQSGLFWRDIADYVGHKHAGLTMDVYASRHTMSDRAAELLVVGQ